MSSGAADGVVTFLMGRDRREVGKGGGSCLLSLGERGQEKGNLKSLLAGDRNAWTLEILDNSHCAHILVLWIPGILVDPLAAVVGLIAWP